MRLFVKKAALRVRSCNTNAHKKHYKKRAEGIIKAI